METRNIQHPTSNTEHSIPEPTSDRLDVECSMLNVGCCRFVGRVWCLFLVCLFLSIPTGFAASTVVAWGDNSSGQTIVPNDLTNVVAIAAGYAHALALRADGTVIGWGDHTSHQTEVPPDLANVVAIAAGEAHSLALRSDGTVVAW